MDGAEVRFEHPDWNSIRGSGLQCADMHFHTNYSDSYTSIKYALKLAKKRNTGVAITDHNIIKGAVQAFNEKDDQFIVPGMEISTWDGPHILVYFYDINEMQEYWKKHIEPAMYKSPWLSTDRDTEYVIDSLEDVNCVISAAHPLGYFMFTKGVQKAINRGYLDPEIAKRFDAYEVICSGMTHFENERAKVYADDHGIGYTGGTDGHLASELGCVVTVSESNDLDGFLTSISRKQNSVIGTEKLPHKKVIMGMASMSRFMQYLPSSLVRQYQVNLGRDCARRRLKRFRSDS